MADHRRFFIDPEQISGQEAVLEGAVVRQLSRVLRLNTGDQITLLDGCGNVHEAAIRTISSDRVLADIVGTRHDVNEPHLMLTLASCLPKNDRMEFVVQKCTELGISQLVLVQSERTIVRDQHKKIERWRKIALEAAEQCCRSRVPELIGIISFEQLVDMIPEFPLAIIAWEEETGPSLKEALNGKQGTGSALVIIGPEGGLTDREVELAKSAGAVSVSLGRRLLRTDTAALAACAAMMYELDGEL